LLLVVSLNLMQILIHFKLIVKPFALDEQGQDLIEYSLLLAFIVLGAAVFFKAAGASVQGVWSAANTRLANAQAVAAS
jgi:Flp pilus assembly pilin Flp